MKNIDNWQDEATKGKDVSDWELEPIAGEGQEKAGEAPVEAEPSVADKRLAELSAEVKGFVPEDPAKKAANVEALQAEIAEMAKSEQKPAVHESVKTEVIATPKEVSMKNVDYYVPSVIDGTGSRVDDYGSERDRIKEASGGLIEYMPNNKGENGYGFEGEGKIPPEKLEKLEANLEATENEKSKEAFDYVKLPDKVRGSSLTKNLKLNDGKGFGSALDSRKMHNEGVRDKIKFGALGTSVLGTISGVAIAGAGSGAAGMALIGLMGGAPLVIGGLGWLGKKIYDSYKEKKAVKNFQTASVAQNMRQSLKSTL